MPFFVCFLFNSHGLNPRCCKFFRYTATSLALTLYALRAYVFAPTSNDLALLITQQHCDMAMFRPRYGPLSCGGPRQRRILDLPYIPLHTHLDNPALTSLWRSTGMTKVNFVRYIVALPDVC